MKGSIACIQMRIERSSSAANLHAAQRTARCTALAAAALNVSSGHFRSESCWPSGLPHGNRNAGLALGLSAIGCVVGTLGCISESRGPNIESPGVIAPLVVSNFLGGVNSTATLVGGTE